LTKKASAIYLLGLFLWVLVNQYIAVFVIISLKKDNAYSKAKHFLKNKVYLLRYTFTRYQKYKALALKIYENIGDTSH